jgi:arabinogalactan endo-1,4-beta-galactosidase
LLAEADQKKRLTLNTTTPMKHFNELGVLALLLTLLIYDVNAQFAKGGDVSWVSQMEDSGYKFYNNNGVQQDLFTILKGKGMNTIRLRVWLNPWEGWCGKNDVLAKAIRAKNAGFRIMIDFHYSDYWADPGQQAKPAAWNSYSVTQLITAIRDHTVDVLNTLKSNGITVEWVQVGNETNDGLLWEDGRASRNMQNYARFITSGYDAVKSVYPSAKVIVHVSNGYDNSLFRWNFDGLKDNGAKWDVIGMSLYPTRSNWPTLNTQCLANMQDMVSRYGKQVMIVEVGMEARQATDCKVFLIDLMNKTASLPNGNGLGVIYWEPQTYGRWQGYTKGAFDEKGRPTVALDAFLTNITQSTLTSQTLSARDSEVIDEGGNRIKTFPNPANQSLSIELPDDMADVGNLTVYNDKGQPMIVRTKVGTHDELDLSALASGFYVLKFTDGKRIITQKFFKR